MKYVLTNWRLWKKSLEDFKDLKDFEIPYWHYKIWQYFHADTSSSTRKRSISQPVLKAEKENCADMDVGVGSSSERRVDAAEREIRCAMSAQGGATPASKRMKESKIWTKVDRPTDLLIGHSVSCPHFVALHLLCEWYALTVLLIIFPGISRQCPCSPIFLYSFAPGGCRNLLQLRWNLYWFQVALWQWLCIFCTPCTNTSFFFKFGLPFVFWFHIAQGARF